jgi:hypothetical protein
MHSPSLSIDEADAESEPEDWSDIRIAVTAGRENHDCGVGGTGLGVVLGMEVTVAFREAKVAVGVGVGEDVARFRWGIGRRL